MTTTQGDRFASCENIVSRSQTSPTDESKKRLVCYQQEQFNLPRDFFVSDSSTCTVNNRKFKMRRRRESQISNSSDKAKEHLCTCITPFCTFLCRQLHDYPCKSLISCFFEGVLLNKQWQNSFSS